SLPRTERGGAQRASARYAVRGGVRSLDELEGRRQGRAVRQRAQVERGNGGEIPAVWRGLLRKIWPGSPGPDRRWPSERVCGGTRRRRLWTELHSQGDGHGGAGAPRCAPVDHG